MSSDMLDVSSVHLIHQIVSYAVSPRHFQTFPDHWCMHIICDGAADFYVSGGVIPLTQEISCCSRLGCAMRSSPKIQLSG